MSLIRIKNTLIIIFCFIFCFSIKLTAQVSIVSNYSCVVPGSTYPYTISGLSWTTGDKWCVTGGTITGSGTTCMNNPGSPTISITWNPGITSGSVSYYVSGSGTPIVTSNVNVAINTITPIFYPFNYNMVPPGKEVSVTFTGSDLSSCGTARYSWAYSSDGINYITIPNSNMKDYVASGVFNTTTYYERTAIVPSPGSTPLVSNPMSIAPATNAVVAGTVSPSAVFVSAGSTLAANTFTATAATGGACGGHPGYYWQISSDNVNWTTAGGNTSSFSPPGVINTKTYIRQVVNCGQPVDISNTVVVNLYAPLNGGLITPNSMVISSGGNPGLLSGSPASDGNTSLGYSYSWVKSIDGGNTFSTTAGNSLSLSPGSITATTYFKRMVTCGTENTYSNTIMIMVGTPVSYQNFIKTRSIMASGITSSGAADALTALTDVHQSTDYFDGLGRPVETVLKQGSLETGNNPVDFVSIKQYDLTGREPQKFLPYASAGTDGSFKVNPVVEQTTFNTTQFPGESYYYGQVNYEHSELNRINSASAAGNNWTGSNRNIATVYTSNTLLDGVREWYVSNSGSIGTLGTYNSPTLYPAGSLYKILTTDEQGLQVIEFKEFDGKTVLKKVQNTAAKDDGSGSRYNGWLCTFYIYDEMNNLRCVVQPKGVELLVQHSWDLTSLNGIILTDQCFRYEYDARNRMIVKQIPGAGPTYMVYDGADRLIMTQDGNLQNTKWLVTVYDDIDRPIQTGLLTNGSTFLTHYNAAYSSIIYPNTTSGFEILSQMHYDDYINLPATSPALSSSFLTTWNSQFAATGTTFPFPVMPAQNSPNTITTKGFPTWTKVEVLNGIPGTSYLSSVNIYDDYGRLVQTQSQNVANGLDINTTQFSWSGIPLVKVQQQNVTAPISQTTILVTNLIYDALGRAVQVQKKVQNSLVNNNIMTGYITIASMKYDVLGQLKYKYLGNSRPSGTYSGSPLESQQFDYNIRGWLLGMNRAYVWNMSYTNATNSQDATTASGETFTGSNGSPIYFGYDLGYDKTTSSASVLGQVFNAAQFSGNISGMVWKSANDIRLRKYDFTYDAVNRLASANFTQYTGTNFNNAANVNFSVSNLSYDANGNILKMTQMGMNTALPTPNFPIVLDQLIYSYKYSGNSNQLLQVTDGGNNASSSTLGDFKYAPSITTKPPGGTDYTYDANGNLATDANKQFSFAYNYMNLPSTITSTASSTKGTITYIYDAHGIKLQKVTVDKISNPWVTTTTNYIGALVYVNGALQSIMQEEGRIRTKPTSNGYVFDYFLKDYLGNVRMTITDDYTLSNSILEVTHYYPFGLTISAISSKASGSLTNKYKFGGKELQSNEFTDGSGMELYDFAARNYDPQIGRWWNNDPEADKAPSLTSYRYALNNPVRFFDPNGKYEEDGHYWTVYLLSTQLKLSNAEQLAAAAEWPDVAETYLLPGLQQRYHALTGGNAGYETGKSEQMIYDAGDNMKNIGIGLHRYGDSYAHRTISNPSVMYGNSIFTLNHAWEDGSAPDKISNRPGLYLEYVHNLNRILDKKFGKTGLADMFTFNYVAGVSKNSSQNNDDIFRSEISILNGVNTFQIDGTSSGAVSDYLKARKNHNASTQDYSIKTVEVTRYELSDDGIWFSHKESQTFVTANH